MSVTWEDVEDGEYGEIKASVNGHEIRVYSDRDDQRWDFQIDDEDSFGRFPTKEEAQREAIRDARES